MQDDPAAGAYGCFFEPLSTCALEDVSGKEMIVFSENPHNDTARIALSEIRRGVANYHPPIGLFEYIWSQRHYPDSLKQEFVARQAHIWGAAVPCQVRRGECLWWGPVWRGPPAPGKWPAKGCPFWCVTPC